MKFTITDNQFPVTDEQGNFLGLYLKVLSAPARFTAALTIELDMPAYINGLHLEPVAGYPFHLLQIQTDGLTAPQGQQLFSGDIVLDRAASIRFPSTLVHGLYLTLPPGEYDSAVDRSWQNARRPADDSVLPALRRPPGKHNPADPADGGSV